ncbi:hypothetical protein B0H14DRAFT_2632975 [Mycena olivaceomarginata]|nr:hypothetical protein B0H14DRAFT_2632975 [Mycena olivaceomarginata]
MTVAMYRGHGAEQLYGLVDTSALQLVPYGQFLNRFQHSTVLTTYILGCCVSPSALLFLEKLIHLYSICGVLEPVRNTEQNPDNDFYPVVYDGLGISRVENVALDEGAIISSCTENDYHDIYVCTPIATGLELYVSTQAIPTLGGILLCATEEPSAIFHIAEPPGMEFKTHRWRHAHNKGDVMDNSWFRVHFQNDYKSDDLLITTHGTDAWPSQANHIFSRLQTTSHFEDYETALVDKIIFQIQQLPNTINPHRPKGYLFLCPPADFRIGPSSFKWPDRPAYWSLDPSGAHCLSSEDTKILGFPALHMGTLVQTRTWDVSTYAGLGRFHQGKDWDPEGQDLARHLGHPLYDLSSGLVSPFAYGELEGPLIRRSPTDHTIEPDELLPLCQDTDPQKCWEFGHYL